LTRTGTRVIGAQDVVVNKVVGAGTAPPLGAADVADVGEDTDDDVGEDTDDDVGEDTGRVTATVEVSGRCFWEVL
jgi:hypothetical protein